MDSNSNPITKANPGMPAIPSSPAPAPVVPTPSDTMPNIPAPADDTVSPAPATSSVPTFTSSNPAANAAPAVPTASSTPTSFGMDSSSYNTGIVSNNGSNGGFDPSSVASFFTPEAPSFSNGGIIAATEPITEPDPIPEPDPEELELKAPFQAAAPVPGSIGSAVSVPKEAPASKEDKKGKKGGLFGKKSAPAEEKEEEPAPLPVDQPINLNSTSPVLSSEPIVNPNNPFLAQNAAPAVPETPAAPVAPVMPEAPAAPVAPVMPEAPAVPAETPAASETPEAPVAPEPLTEPVMQATPETLVENTDFMGVAPNPEIPQFDPNSPLPMPGDPMMPTSVADPMQNMGMPPASPDMPFAQDFANNQLNPFAEAAVLNADPNAQNAIAPAKAKNNKKLFIIGGAAAAVLLIIVLVVVMMGGGKKSANTASNNPTPAPTPTPTMPTNGTTTCTKKYDEERLSVFAGAENGSRNISIKYENQKITDISMNDTIDFDNETSRKSGLRTLKDEYNNDITTYNITDDTEFTTDCIRDVLSITCTRSASGVRNLSSGATKLFGITSEDGEFIAEDTIAGLEEKGFTCKEKDSDVDEEKDDEEDDEGENSNNDIDPSLN